MVAIILVGIRVEGFLLKVVVHKIIVIELVGDLVIIQIPGRSNSHIYLKFQIVLYFKLLA